MFSKFTITTSFPSFSKLPPMEPADDTVSWIPDFPFTGVFMPFARRNAIRYPPPKYTPRCRISYPIRTNFKSLQMSVSVKEGRTTFLVPPRPPRLARADRSLPDWQLIVAFVSFLLFGRAFTNAAAEDSAGFNKSYHTNTFPYAYDLEVKHIDADLNILQLQGEIMRLIPDFDEDKQTLAHKLLPPRDLIELRIDADLNILQLQEEIMRLVTDFDEEKQSHAQKLLPPRDLIELCLEVKCIDADLNILQLQEEIMKLIADDDEEKQSLAQKLLPPRDLIELCLNIENRELSLRAFDLFTWTSASYIICNTSLLEDCWRNAANQDDWEQLYQMSITEGWSDEMASEKLRETVLFQASSKGYGPNAETFDVTFKFEGYVLVCGNCADAAQGLSWFWEADGYCSCAWEQWCCF